jgi:hypothetical protein
MFAVMFGNQHRVSALSRRAVAVAVERGGRAHLGCLPPPPKAAEVQFPCLEVRSRRAFLRASHAGGESSILDDQSRHRTRCLASGLPVNPKIATINPVRG